MPQVLPNARIQHLAPGLKPSSLCRVLDAPRPLRLWHLASLDAPTVALVWSLAFAWVARVRLPFWLPPLLALAVFTCYIADRLLDARAALRSASTHRLRDRHLFHWRHRRVFLPLAAATASAAAIIVFHCMPVAAQERNSLLAAASLVYFTRVHAARAPSPFPSRLLSKELLVGLLFTAGCALPAWSRATTPTHMLSWPLFTSVAFFALLAWLNCHAIDRWEAPSDHAPQPSLAPKASLVALAGLLLSVLVVSAQPRAAALLATGAAAALLLALLDTLRNRLTPIALRAAADLALLTPLLLTPLVPLLK